MSTRIAAANVKLKRAYDPAAATDGTRVLVDRLWPRGVPKENAELDQWMKEIAPSTALRQWFGHDPGRWKEFGRAALPDGTAREYRAAPTVTRNVGFRTTRAHRIRYNDSELKPITAPAPRELQSRHAISGYLDSLLCR